MTKEPTRRRRLLAGRRPVVRHAPPPAPVEVLEPPADHVSRETTDATVHPMAPYVAGGQVPACCCGTLRPGEACPAHPFDPTQYKPAEEELPPLPRERAALLEELTAIWSTQARIAGSQPDSTMFYASSRPPVPPPIRYAEDVTLEPATPPEFDLVEDPLVNRLAKEARDLDDAGKLPGPARRVSDWTSRHDPRSLEYAVRGKLARPVPLQDFLLERGPVLDQGTTPPLSAKDASACVGMAVVAAANALDLASRPVYSRTSPEELLGVDEARAIYGRAQELDHVSGESYAGTSVLAGMKAGQEAGYWDAYLWALGGTRDVAQALLQLRAPVVLGLPWTAGLEEPNAAGIIEPTGPAAGGHALTVVGLRLVLAGRPGPWFALQQSRGPAEGDAGLVYLHHRHLAQLLAGVGEAAVPLPRWGLS